MTYLLIAMVLLLWGTIFYRFFSGLGDTHMPPAVAAGIRPAEALPLVAITDTLMLGYSDPFLGSDAHGQEATLQDHNEESYREYELESLPYVDWSIIQYLGSVQNANRKKAIALVRIGGKDYMFTVGQTHDGFTMVGMTSRAITMRHQNTAGEIPLQHNPDGMFSLTDGRNWD